MVKLRDWLKNNKEKTKGITKEKFDEVKNKTKQKYNEVLDTEVEEIQDRTKQFVGQATETTKGYLTAILLILYFVFWLFVPTIFFILVNLISGINDAFEIKLLRDESTPGAITPPIY